VFESRASSPQGVAKCLDLSVDSSQKGQCTHSAQVDVPPLSREVSSFHFRCRKASYNEWRVPVVENFDLTVQGGRCVGLHGPNGAGKTTVLRAIAGVLPDFDGEIELEGSSLIGMPPEKRCRLVALAMQEPRDQLFEETVAKELSVGARLARGLSGERLAAAVKDCAHALGIGYLLPRHPRELSRSETRWVGIASMLVLGAPILLLDEPSVGMDQGGIDRLSSIIARHKSRGGCVIVASHELEWLEAVSDEVIGMCIGGTKQ
jgi:energy-coupling factor transporter ATP-binding protein EcfA2